MADNSAFSADLVGVDAFCRGCLFSSVPGPDLECHEEARGAIPVLVAGDRGGRFVVYRRGGSSRAPASPLTGTRSRVPMGPRSKVRLPESSDDSQAGGKIGTLQPQDSQPSPFSAEMPTRQCGRCRQYFAVGSLISPQPKWWACPPCHRQLFGAG